MIDLNWRPTREATAQMVEMKKSASIVKTQKEKPTVETLAAHKRVDSILPNFQTTVMPYVRRYAQELRNSPLRIAHALARPSTGGWAMAAQPFQPPENTTVKLLSGPNTICGSKAPFFRTTHSLSQGPLAGYWQGNMEADEADFHAAGCVLRRPSASQLLRRMNGTVLRVMGDSNQHGQVSFVEKWFKESGMQVRELATPGCSSIRGANGTKEGDISFTLCYRFLLGRWNDASGISVWGDGIVFR